MADAGELNSCCAGGASGSKAGAERREQPVEPSAASIPFRWCRLDGGEFRMGAAEPGFPADGEGPVRTVRLSGFAICAYAVTNSQFADFVRDTGYVTDAERFNWSFVFHSQLPEPVKARVQRVPRQTPWWYPVTHAYWAQPEGAGSTVYDRLDHPVVHVSWNDAQAYCRWSGTRLPTEAEWEFAARGGLDQKLYPWGDELTPRGEHCCNIWQGRFPVVNTAHDGYAGTAPVHAFAPNGYGLFNVAGNVWEWCADWFSPEYHRVTDATNPLFSQDTGSRSMRGGSFLCHASYCNRYRVAARSSNAPDSSSSNVGLRVATSLPSGGG